MPVCAKASTKKSAPGTAREIGSPAPISRLRRGRLSQASAGSFPEARALGGMGRHERHESTGRAVRAQLTRASVAASGRRSRRTSRPASGGYRRRSRRTERTGWPRCPSGTGVGHRQPAGAQLDRLTDGVAPGQRVAPRGASWRITSVRAASVRGRCSSGAGALRARHRDAVEVPAVGAVGALELRVELNADSVRGVGPLPLEVLGRGDGDPAALPPVEQPDGDPQGERGLADGGRRDREEVPRALGDVQLEGLGPPGAELGGGTPRVPDREGGRQGRGGGTAHRSGKPE
jgi:hypothetical protein